MFYLCKIWLIIFLIVLFNSAEAQVEHVNNGGFEQYSELPDWQNQLNRAAGWFNPMYEGCNITQQSDSCGTPDYFHVNSSNNVAGLPDNYYAFVQPNEGSGIGGFIGWNNVGIREYVSNQLISETLIGKRYAVQFFITNGSPNATDPGTGWGVNGIAIAFSTFKPTQLTPILELTPVHTIDTILFSSEWTAVSFEFVADSSYSYLSIGNFTSPSTVEFQNFVPESSMYNTAYYFIDDVSVIRLDTANSIYEWENAVRTFSQTEEQIGIGLDARVHNATATLYDMAGRETGRVSGNGSSLSLPIGRLLKGTYILQLRTDMGTVSRKVVIP